MEVKEERDASSVAEKGPNRRNEGAGNEYVINRFRCPVAERIQPWKKPLQNFFCNVSRVNPTEENKLEESFDLGWGFAFQISFAIGHLIPL